MNHILQSGGFDRTRNSLPGTPGAPGKDEKETALQARTTTPTLKGSTASSPEGEKPAAVLKSPRTTTSSSGGELDNSRLISAFEQKYSKQKPVKRSKNPNRHSAPQLFQKPEKITGSSGSRTHGSASAREKEKKIEKKIEKEKAIDLKKSEREKKASASAANAAHSSRPDRKENRRSFRQSLLVSPSSNEKKPVAEIKAQTPQSVLEKTALKTREKKSLKKTGDTKQASAKQREPATAILPAAGGTVPLQLQIWNDKGPGLRKALGDQTHVLIGRILGHLPSFDSQAPSREMVETAVKKEKLSFMEKVALRKLTSKEFNGALFRILGKGTMEDCIVLTIGNIVSCL
jgi:hypothetical protein